MAEARTPNSSSPPRFAEPRWLDDESIVLPPASVASRLNLLRSLPTVTFPVVWVPFDPDLPSVVPEDIE